MAGLCEQFDCMKSAITGGFCELHTLQNIANQLSQTTVRDTVPSILRQTSQVFETGAMRDLSEDKLDFEGCLTPELLTAYAEFKRITRRMADGTMRDDKNWKKGMPIGGYMKSLWRHMVALHAAYLSDAMQDEYEGEGEFEAAMAMMFNIQGFVFERIRENPEWLRIGIKKHKERREAELAARRAQIQV